MIYVRDKGRMCNNILQFGHVYAWAREHGRSAVSMRFCYKYNYFAICDMPRHNFPTYLFAKYAAKLGLLPVAAFHCPDGNPEAMALLESRKNLVVEGWEVRFYDLFIKYLNEIRRLFAFKPHIYEALKPCLELPKGCSIRLGLHIRRGDYRTWCGGKYFYADEVYVAYVRHLASLHPGERIVVYVCGNDPALDKDYYTSSLPEVEVRFPQGNPGEDLCLLSQCDYLIGPPSTFTLVASMYHDTPLCWMETADARQMAFGHFDELFRNIR